MKQDDLINTLFHSRDPLDGLDKVQSYYDRYYDYNIIVIDRNEANKYLERIPYHLGDLVVGYVINKDKVGTSFLLGSEEDIAKECTSLMLYKKDHEISKTFNRVFTHLFNFCRKFG